MYLNNLYWFGLFRAFLRRRGGGQIFRQSFVLVLQTSGQTMLKFITKQNMIKIYHVVQGLSAFLLTDHDKPKWCSAKPCHRFAYQCLGNAKCDPNIPCKSKIMSIFTTMPLLVEMMLDKAFAYRWLDNVKIRKCKV